MFDAEKLMAAGRVCTSPLESLMPLKLKVSEDGGMLQIVLYIEAIFEQGRQFFIPRELKNRTNRWFHYHGFITTQQSQRHRGFCVNKETN